MKKIFAASVIMGILSVLLSFCARKVTGFAQTYSVTVYPVLKGIFARISGIFPFMEKDGFVNEVKEEVRQFALSSLSSQTGNYSSVQVRKNQADITEETWAAALLPVWTVTYNDKARGKIYYFALNGQTGKIWGELPVDNKKLAVLFLSIFVPVCVILLFLGYWIG